MKARVANAAHEVAYQELVALVGAHKNEISAAEMLAIASNMLGKLLALQDQRTMTREQAMLIVSENIEIGNKQAMEQVMSAGGKPT